MTTAPQAGSISPDAAEIRGANITTERVAALLKSQYYASLTMLREAVEKSSDALWSRESDTNKTWQQAYHALYFTHLYLQPTAEDFTPWPGQHRPSQNDDGIPGPADPASDLPVSPDPYTKAEVLDYLAWVRERVDRWVDALDLTQETCGFSWYTVSKLEHQFVNLRHLQHHAAQIAERLRTSEGQGVRWQGRGKV